MVMELDSDWRLVSMRSEHLGLQLALVFRECGGV